MELLKWQPVETHVDAPIRLSKRYHPNSVKFMLILTGPDQKTAPLKTLLRHFKWRSCVITGEGSLGVQWH